MSGALDRFFEHYYRRRPVNATFTGVHAYDELLPDWSLAGLQSQDDEMRSTFAELAVAHPSPASVRGYRDDAGLLDAELARGFLEIQLAENASAHGMRGNPALWTGEAIFSIVALMIRDFAPLEDRLLSASARIDAIPEFLADAKATIGSAAIPAAWTARALRECGGATVLLTRGLDAWLTSVSHLPSGATRLRSVAARANDAFAQFAEWLRSHPAAPHTSTACGGELFDLLLARGHQSVRSRADLLEEARAGLPEAQKRLREMTRATYGSWEAAQEQLASDHPAPDNYLDAFARTWVRCHERATSQDVVSWPDWPIRYVTFPEWTRDAAPFLYYLYYRSPAPFDSYGFYDYVVPSLPLSPADQEQHLRAWNHSAIKLNHVVHHGAIGHHVQNWHAYHRAPSRAGKVAAVDCASRIGMHCGGTMAEGWACYATDLMEELDFLSPLERLSEQHSRVRFLARAIVDIELHQQTMSFDNAVRFYMEQTGMSADSAHGETVKNSMFPCTAIMYWLGTKGILDLRDTTRQRLGSAFSLKSFHDELLGHGSIPVPLVARLMTENLT